MFQEFPDDNLNSSFLNERRQRIAEDNILNLEERRNDLRRSKSVFIGAVSGLALAGVVGWFALSPRYSTQTPTEIPTIRRPQEAVKVRPENPGGMEILNQDKSVYDIIDNSDAAEPKVESILPPPEQPVMPEIKPVAEPEAPAAAPVETPAIASETVVSTAPVAVAQEVKAVVNEEPEVKLPTIKEASQQKPLVQKAEKAVAQPSSSAQPVAAVSKTSAIMLDKMAKQQQAAPAAKPAPKASGDWMVQLMSSPNQKAVTSAWNGLVKKHPALSGQAHEIETADLGAKGTYYRLLAGGFADRSGADKLCNSIKKQGGTCIVKKK